MQDTESPKPENLDVFVEETKPADWDVAKEVNWAEAGEAPEKVVERIPSTSKEDLAAMINEAKSRLGVGNERINQNLLRMAGKFEGQPLTDWNSFVAQRQGELNGGMGKFDSVVRLHNRLAY